MKTILLTGGTGFLGSSLLTKLLEQPDIAVIVLKRSTSKIERIESSLNKIITYDLDRVSLSSVFQKHSIHTVIHCATNYGRTGAKTTEMIDANFVLPLQLLEAASENNVRCFINTDTALNKETNPYALSKKQLLEWLHVFSNKMVCINLILEYFYGGLDDATKLITFIIQSFIQEKPYLELTEGKQERDFIYIEDVVNAFLLILNDSGMKNNGFYEYQVGSGTTITIKDLILKIQALMHASKTELRFGALPYRKNEMMESRVDLTAIKKLGWRPKINLEVGLHKTIMSEKSRK